MVVDNRIRSWLVTESDGEVWQNTSGGALNPELGNVTLKLPEESMPTWPISATTCARCGNVIAAFEPMLRTLKAPKNAVPSELTPKRRVVVLESMSDLSTALDVVLALTRLWVLK